ncbi:MAG: hypothetical protein BalsKO_02150 [Balneolaceae bacterium]
MKISKLTLLIFPLFVFMPKLADAQATRTMSFDASNSLMLQEFQAMLTFENEIISVATRLGRGDSEPGVDRLEQGDILLMMNGKRVRDIETLKEIYEGLEPEAEIKIGVRRGEERFILNAVKGEIPEGGPRMVMNFDSDEGASGEGPVIIPSLGILLTDTEEGVLVDRLIAPILPDELKTLEIEKYLILSINNEKPETSADFKEKIDAIALGNDISLTFEKDGDEKSITIKKTAPRGNISINTRNN